MLKVGIIGATGYAGIELMRILSRHPEVEVRHIGSQSYAGQEYVKSVGAFRHIWDDALCQDLPLSQVAESCDAVFLALPHGIASQQVNTDILEKTCIIDLGADYRLKDVATYEKWYGVGHGSPDLIQKAVYGLPELNRNQIRQTNLIANPGCYTTCSILTLKPLVRENIISGDPDSGHGLPIIIDAKSGVSGAGRKAQQSLHYAETNESIKAYKIATHRHTPEIEEKLSESNRQVRVQFTPHLVPMNRGILVSAYIPLPSREAEKISASGLRELYESYYSGENFIRILPDGIFPETRWVRGSNYVDIGLTIDQRTNTLIAFGAIDNLVKGAAGQAVQNMNIRFGFPEDLGLETAPIFP